MSARWVTAEPKNVDLNAVALVKSGSCGTRPAEPFHHALPAALTKPRDRGSSPMWSERNCCPLKYASLVVMIASTLRLVPLTVRCFAPVRLNCQSMDQVVEDGAGLDRAPLTCDGAATPGPE